MSHGEQTAYNDLHTSPAKAMRGDSRQSRWFERGRTRQATSFMCSSKRSICAYVCCPVSAAGGKLTGTLVKHVQAVAYFCWVAKPLLLLGAVIGQDG